MIRPAPLAAVALTLLASAALAQTPGTTFRDCPDCPEMVVIPAGAFTMGSDEAETLREDGMDAAARKREQPAHRVTIAKPFAVSRFEITRAEYARFADATKRTPGATCVTWDQAKNAWQENVPATWRNPNFPQTEKDPVVCVSLEDAQAYVAWLSTQARVPYRIITEAEWEYVARAGTKTSRYWGDTAAEICKHANISDATAAEPHPELKQETTRTAACRDDFVYTAPVGSFDANPFGVYDIIGNVWEWTADCFIESYDGAPTDGSARVTPGCPRYVVRGGGWYARNWFNRTAARSREVVGGHMGTLGIRIARDLAPR